MNSIFSKANKFVTIIKIIGHKIHARIPSDSCHYKTKYEILLQDQCLFASSIAHDLFKPLFVRRIPHFKELPHNNLSSNRRIIPSQDAND